MDSKAAQANAAKIEAKLSTARAQVAALTDRQAFYEAKSKALVYPVQFEHDKKAAAELAEVNAELTRTNALLSQANDTVTNLIAELETAQAAHHAALVTEARAVRDETEARVWDTLIEVIAARDALELQRQAYTTRIDELYTVENNLRGLGAEVDGWQKPLRESELTREHAESRRDLLRQHA